VKKNQSALKRGGTLKTVTPRGLARTRPLEVGGEKSLHQYGKSARVPRRRFLGLKGCIAATGHIHTCKGGVVLVELRAPANWPQTSLREKLESIPPKKAIRAGSGVWDQNKESGGG